MLTREELAVPRRLKRGGEPIPRQEYGNVNFGESQSLFDIVIGTTAGAHDAAISAPPVSARETPPCN